MKFVSLSLALAVSLGLFGCGGPANDDSAATDDEASPLAWQAKFTEWSPAHEQGFSDYVAKIGKARIDGRCTTVSGCMAMVPPGDLPAEKAPSTANPDCGRLPFLLRAYYAYRMKLPFAYQAYTSPSGTKDSRYTAEGNTVSGHKDQIDARDLSSFFAKGFGDYWSANYRTAATPNVNHPNAFSDLYPVAINRSGVGPGTVYYNAGGHIGMVISRGPDGKMLTWNGHPDGSNSVREFNQTNFENPPMRSRKYGGFLKFRSWIADGSGRVDTKARPNPNQADFSMQQYGDWTLNGKTYDDYFKFVRASLGGGKVDPVAEFQSLGQELCTKLNDRAKAVQGAVDAGTPSKQHPGMPRNMFGADGDWEAYSTPSSDMRSKLGYMALYSLVKASLADAERGSSAEYAISGSAAQLAAKYKAAWASLKAQPACQIRPKLSSGTGTITIETAVTSVFDWSFDPYHSPELRWGLVSASPDNAAKKDIYTKQAKLRWNTLKDPAAATTYDWGNNTARPATDFLSILAKY